MNILITGGAGYIGCHTAEVLTKKGYKVYILDNLINSDLSQIVSHSQKIYIGDYGNKKLVKNIIKKHNIQAIIHLGGLISVGESVKHPFKYYYYNFYKTYHLIKIAEKLKIKHFIFASSAAVYGNNYSKILSENQILKPQSPYGKTKLLIEQLLQKSKMNYGILRYFNVAGASSTIGEKHKNEFHIIPKIIEAVTNDNLFFIFGDNYLTSDGTCIRDYVHVKDVALANLQCLEYLSNNNTSIIINVGSGKGHSILEIIQIVKSLNLPIKYCFTESKKGDPPILVADINQIKEKLNWTPKHSNIVNIINDYFNWYTNFSN